jgi:hypothetical protein
VLLINQQCLGLWLGGPRLKSPLPLAAMGSVLQSGSWSLARLHAGWPNQDDQSASRDSLNHPLDKETQEVSRNLKKYLL